MNVHPKVRDLVRGRGVDCCERCGVHAPRGQGNLHHRRPRGMGGTRNPELNQPANLLWLCGSGTTGCHGDIESNRAAALAAGWLVPRYKRPTEIPVEIWDAGLGRRVPVLLDNDGGWREAGGS